MGGVQSGTHNLGDALWVQERQKQKCYRDGTRYDSNGYGSQQPQQSGSNVSTQDRRKLLKRTRSLAVISEDESRATSSGGETCTFRFGSSCGSTPSPLDSVAAASLQRRRHQLIPRAKLIDRNSLKDRLSKSQQHLNESYERYSEEGQHERVCQSRSVCGLYSLPPPLDPFPCAARASCYPKEQQQQHQQQTSYVLEDCLGSNKLNIIKWPEQSSKRYRSVQDLNTVTGLVDIVEDTYWPGEENRSVDCIYTQVKRKRKEHRSLDSILFEDDSNELEYFDILNLLPLSNVRLEINDLDVLDNNVIQERGSSETPNRELKSNPTVISVSTKPKPASNGGEKCCKHSKSEDWRTTIDKIVSPENDEKKSKNRSATIYEPATSDISLTDKGITSFPELAREKSRFESKRYSYDGKVDLLKRRENQGIKVDVSSPSKAKDTANKQEETDQKKKESLYLKSVEKKLNSGEEKLAVEETEDTKSIWISDNEESEEMSRRPQVLKIIDNDITKSKSMPKNLNLEMNSKDKENNYESATTNYQIYYKLLNKPDLINDHIHESNSDMNISDEKSRSSVENARNFFEKKTSDHEPLTNHQCEGRFERIVKETSNILGKACNAVKGSLGFEARSECSDLGLGSEIGSDVRRLSVDECTNIVDDKANDQKQIIEHTKQCDNNEKNKKNCTNLTRSISFMDSIECQDSDEPEFDHVRYKIVKSNVFSKSIFNNSKKDVTYDGLMQYLREYSFQDLLMENNVVIIEPVRAEVERKPSFNDSKLKSSPSIKVSTNSLETIKVSDANGIDQKSERTSKNHFAKTPRQSSLRKHFFYQPIRVNRELNDDELPDPDTVRNVRKMFEETMKGKLAANHELMRDCSTRKSVSMKDLRTIEIRTFDSESERSTEAPRSRCSSRAKDLTKMFENMEKASFRSSISESRDDVDSPKGESKTRSIAQSFEARSGQTSPSNSNSSKLRINSRYQQRQLHNWDAGSVSSGVSSDYPDTDAGSAPHCTSSEDEDLYCQDDDGVDEPYEGHYVSPDVLKKIRECGTSVTYYGGKVVNSFNGPLISPMVSKNSKGSNKSLDYVKFRLVKSNSCDSRLELTGRIIDNRNKYQPATEKCMNLRQFTIDETPSIEITPAGQNGTDKNDVNSKGKEEKREPPVVIGLEPKKEESKTFKADFKLGKVDDIAAGSISRFTPSALTRWQINESAWKRTSDFGKMEFEEFEVLEDSLNGADN